MLAGVKGQLTPLACAGNKACQQKLAETCKDQITGVEAARVTDSFNKRLSGAQAHLGRSAASLLLGGGLEGGGTDTRYRFVHAPWTCSCVFSA